MTDFTLTCLSLGAGVQSTALYVACVLGLRDFPTIGRAIFADTGDEPAYVYTHLDWLRQWGGDRVPIDVISAGCLSANIRDRIAGTLSRTAGIPSFTAGKDGRTGMLKRQCTAEFKIRPIQKHLRKLLGVGFRQRVPKGVRVRQLIGISLDEAHRMAPARVPWIENDWPLCDARMKRSDCITLLTSVGVPVPGKSACVYCPMHSDEYWLELKTKHPADFAKAVEMDRIVRGATRTGIRNPVFLHRSLKPLEEINFEARVETQQGRLDFGEECGGSCGV